MKNNFLFFITIIFFNVLIFSTEAYEQFNFDITEVEILNEGNRFLGKKRGKITTADGIEIESNNFEYDKILNIIYLSGKVDFFDTKKNYKIFSNEAIYFRNIERIVTKGPTQILVDDRYDFKSSDVEFLRDKSEFSSLNNSSILDKKINFYEMKNFKYLIKDKLLKAQDLKITTNYLKEKSDIFFFENAFINLLNNNFIAKKTHIQLHKDIFDKEREKFINLENEKLNILFDDYYEENNPRLYGASSNGDENKTIIHKGVFTSCKKKDGCPPWSLNSEKITHDKIKKQLIYKNAILNVYQFPVFYFPKFFHPDPTVDRQSGFLRPRFNSSKILGSSLYLPYFKVISDDKDITFKPTFFDGNVYMLQNEYRQSFENSNLITDFSITKNYNSTIPDSNKNSIGHVFGKMNIDLKLKNYNSSKIELFVEKVTNDSYLNVFETSLFSTPLKPKNNNSTHSGLKFNIDDNNFNFSSGIDIYETLSGHNSDRYQYVFPYYSVSKNLDQFDNFNLSISSNGSNSLQNTNNLKSKIINDIYFSSKDIIYETGFLNNFNSNFKNLNSLGKNDSVYKSTPQINNMAIFEYISSFPLIKFDENYYNVINPKISLRASPNDMKNYSSLGRKVNVDNIFSLNRLGVSDSVEPGRSLTIGIDYRKEKIEDAERFFEFKLATSYRDKIEEDIPISSTLNQKSSNIYGSIETKLSKNINLNYGFSLDNDWNTLESSSLDTEFSTDTFVTNFNFTKTFAKMGNQDTVSNETSIKFNNNNYLTFETRRNRAINLTEFYDFVYEYKNDCLTAGVAYKKTYYSNEDLKPNEDLMFTITLFPLTKLDQKVDQSFYRSNVK